MRAIFQSGFHHFLELEKLFLRKIIRNFIQGKIFEGSDQKVHKVTAKHDYVLKKYLYFDLLT